MIPTKTIQRPIPFNHNPIEFQEFKTDEGKSGRFYHINPEERYPSVTTMLSYVKGDTTALDNWKKRLGEMEAEKQTRYATDHGTRVHKYCEDYLNNIPVTFDNPKSRMVFLTSKKALDPIDNIRGQEVCLYSHKLKLAGRCDCVADYDGVPSIIDFKTSKKQKQEKFIENYFIQTTIYSIMLHEMTGLQHRQIVLVFFNADGSQQKFIEPMRKYVPIVLDKMKQFNTIRRSVLSGELTPEK